MSAAAVRSTPIKIHDLFLHGRHTLPTKFLRRPEPIIKREKTEESEKNTKNPSTVKTDAAVTSTNANPSPVSPIFGPLSNYNRVPSPHVLNIAENLVSLKDSELTALRKEIRSRLSVGKTKDNKDFKPILGLAARANFPHPKDYFRGNGFRELPVPTSVFAPGLILPQLSAFFGARARYGLGKSSTEDGKSTSQEEESIELKSGNVQADSESEGESKKGGEKDAAEDAKKSDEEIQAKPPES